MPRDLEERGRPKPGSSPPNRARNRGPRCGAPNVQITEKAESDAPSCQKVLRGSKPQSPLRVLPPDHDLVIVAANERFECKHD